MKYENKKRQLKDKICIFMLVSVMLVAVTGVGFASDARSSMEQKAVTAEPFTESKTLQHGREADKSLLYRKIKAATVSFHIEKNMAKSTVIVNAGSSKCMDHAFVIVKFVNKNTGKSSVYSGKMKKRGLKFIYGKKHKVSKKGAYYVRAKIRCYKGDRIVETIDKVSVVRNYKK